LNWLSDLTTRVAQFLQYLWAVERERLAKDPKPGMRLRGMVPWQQHRFLLAQQCGPLIMI
jgi:hypothetical protein